MRVIRMNKVYGIEVNGRLAIASYAKLRRILKKELKLEKNIADKILKDGGII